MTRGLLLFGTSIVLAAAPAATAQLVKFEILDQSFSANDLSPDGQWVVGDANGGGGYLWSKDTGYTMLGGVGAIAVSDDGSVVLGSIEDGETGNWEAGIYSGGTWTQIPPAPGATGCPYFTTPYELSGDGTAAVGLGWNGCSGQGFLWTLSGGTSSLEWLANGNNRASVISGDGSLIGGFAQGSFSRTPAVWSFDSTGSLLDPPNGDILGEVHGISDDGTVLTGEWDNKPFIWRDGQAIEVFNPVLPGWIGNAMDIADDDTIVGFDILLTSRRAWIRPNGGPAEDLHTYLANLGATVPLPFLEVCQAVSANGNILIGHNAFSNGWLVNLCAPDLSGNGEVDFADILAVIGAWGPCPAGCSADIDDSGDVGFGDILAVIGAWGTCP